MKTPVMLRMALLVYVALIIGLFFAGKLTGPLWNIAIAIFLIASGVMDSKDPRIAATKFTRIFSRITLLLGVVLLVLGVFGLLS